MRGAPPEPGQAPAAEVELLLFQLEGARVGADASQVLRIERPGVPGLRRSPLGSATPKRSLVFKAGEAEGVLAVDLVLGVRSVRARDLRRVPAAARIAGHALGFWLDGDQPVLLIDLPLALSAQAPEANPDPRKAT